MRRILFATLVVASAMAQAGPAKAGPVYVALGDSITFGETNLAYAPSDGNRGYVANYANYLGTLTGTPPTVVNLAIDGETTASFLSGSGRVPPVVGRTDAILAAENTHYTANPSETQNVQLLTTVAAEKAAGNTITTVSITLGFNDLSTLVGLPASAVAPTLAAYQANYAYILSEIHQLTPNANVLVLGYFNPFPANPTSPAAPIFNAYGMQLNGIISSLAAQYGDTYVNTAPPFVGNEAAYTYLAQMPAGSSSPPVGPYQGTLPIGNVHPNAAGYQAITSQLIGATPSVVPEPASAMLLAAGCACLLLAARRGKGLAG